LPPRTVYAQTRFAGLMPPAGGSDTAEALYEMPIKIFRKIYIEKIFYKYKTINEFTLDSIIYGYLYFSQHSELNDLHFIK
jgi:hypothetical protein